MPRDSGGTYTLPAGSTATTGTTILASELNTPLSDIASALTASLPVDGSKGMSGALKAANGSASSPSYTFGSETNSGFYRNGAGDIRASIVTADVMTLGASAVSIMTPANSLVGNPTGGAALSAGVTLAGGLKFVGTTLVSATTSRGFIDGCKIANGTDAINDIDFAVGSCRDSTNVTDIVCAAMTKQLDASWAAGTAAGGRMSAAAIADTTYHCFAIMKADGTQDWGFHTGVDPTADLPSGYIYFRRVGSIVRASSAILAFQQWGDRFDWVNSTLDYNTTGPGTSAITVTLSVPVGIVVQADCSLMLDNAGGSEVHALISPLFATDEAVGSGNGDIVNGGPNTTATGNAPKSVLTNTSAQIRAKLSISTNVTLKIRTRGWVDMRGKNS